MCFVFKFLQLLYIETDMQNDGETVVTDDDGDAQLTWRDADSSAIVHDLKLQQTPSVLLNDEVIDLGSDAPKENPTNDSSTGPIENAQEGFEILPLSSFDGITE